MIRNAVSQAMPALRRPGEALRPAAGAARVAAGFVVGRAILVRVNQIALSSLGERVPAARKCLLWCSGCVDARPTDNADIIALLQRGNLRRGIGGIAVAFTDSGLPGRNVCNQEQAAQRHA